MIPGQYIKGDDATLESLFLKKVQTVTTGLLEYHMARSHLDDLFNALHESGSSPPGFLKLPNPSNPEPNLEPNVRVWGGFDEDDNDDYDAISIDNMLQQGVLEANDDFQAHVDRENSRKAQQAKEEEEGQVLVTAAYDGELRATETIKQVLRDATGKRVGKSHREKLP
jgi:hypothetical protein